MKQDDKIQRGEQNGQAVVQLLVKGAMRMRHANAPCQCANMAETSLNKQMERDAPRCHAQYGIMTEFSLS